MPVAELLASYQPARNSVTLAAGYRVDRLGSQEDLLRAGYLPYAILPGRQEAVPRPVALAIERPAAVAECCPADRVDGRGARIDVGMSAARLPDRQAVAVRRPMAGERPLERQAVPPAGTILVARRPIERGGSARWAPTPEGQRIIERAGIPRSGLSAGVRLIDRPGIAHPVTREAMRPVGRDVTLVVAGAAAGRSIERLGATRPVLVLPDRDAERTALLIAGYLPVARDPSHEALVVAGRWADRDASKSAVVMPAPWRAVHDGDRTALVVWGSRPIEYLGGNTIIMRPHIMGALNNLRVVEVLPHRPPAARVDEHGAAVGHGLAGARPVEHGADIVWLVAGERPSELGAAMIRLGLAGERPTSLGGVMVRLAAAGERPTVHGAVVGGFAAAGSRPAEHGSTVWHRPLPGGTEARAAAMLWAPMAVRETVEPGLVLARLPLLVPVPKQALVVAPQPMADKAPKDGRLVLPRWWAETAPKEARSGVGLWVERDQGRTTIVVPGRPTGGELPDAIGAAPYMPRPKDNERPYDSPQEPWPDTEPITGPYNPPPPPSTDPETGAPVNPPPQNHVEPPPNSVADPVTGEPRHPTGGTDPVTGDPEILPPRDPAHVPGDMCGAVDEADVPEGVLLEFIARFWDVWKTFEVYYGHVTADEAVRHLLSELVRWLGDNPYDPRYWVLYCDLRDCARSAVMRYCRTYLRKQWGQERASALDYGTDAFNTGNFMDPSRWTVSGWSFRYHLNPTDIALAPDGDGATVTLSCNLPDGGWVDFEYLIATGNAMRLIALPSGTVLWSAEGTVDDPYGVAGPHASVEVPPGTTGLQWVFEWKATTRQESIDYGTDDYNAAAFLDATRWTVTGWSFKNQSATDIALAPDADGATAELSCNLPDGGRVEFEVAVTNGNQLQLVALPSGTVVWSSAGTTDEPYGTAWPKVAVELPAGTTAIRWQFAGTAVAPSGLRALIDVVTVYRYAYTLAAPPSGLAGILDVVTLWRYDYRQVLIGAWPETVCEPNRGNDAVRDAWECWRRKWEERHKDKTLRRRWLVT
ncbi:hypothetical protein Tmar_0053 [Thermaerobacter marianensis DSM 12885]|uniref:Uncharacterized protein n=1 Tax=Thermaerobacter marianensis (strain ATCC 700841 / DSM 12885 / JCM 10246 / 7p75a) TaxID=644966 RepID=E6SKJ1_THEM7|nr:hypothetical protein [Thermaerobacter marianensis]ADU50178.1 hypothetical protein Tmar_0053 [Thermaerobacter marianensis DSM 12885]